MASNSNCSYRKIIVELDIDKTMNACPVGKLFEAAPIEIETKLEKVTLLPA